MVQKVWYCPWTYAKKERGREGEREASVYLFNFFARKW